MCVQAVRVCINRGRMDDEVTQNRVSDIVAAILPVFNLLVQVENEKAPTGVGAEPSPLQEWVRRLEVGRSGGAQGLPDRSPREASVAALELAGRASDHVRVHVSHAEVQFTPLRLGERLQSHGYPPRKGTGETELGESGRRRRYDQSKFSSAHFLWRNPSLVRTASAGFT